MVPWNDTADRMAHALTNEGGFNGTESERRLIQAISTLPPRQQMVFNLRYYDEMPYEEMAELLGVSEGALKASYHHAFNKVTDIIKQG
jgi:RNA polymerase sigma-70 factor (ECF subfamily)